MAVWVVDGSVSGGGSVGGGWQCEWVVVVV